MNALQLGSVYFSLKTKNIKLFTRILYIIIIIIIFREERERANGELDGLCGNGVGDSGSSKQYGSNKSGHVRWYKQVYHGCLL